MAGNKSLEDSQKRGYIVFAFVLLVNVWLFTIPVEFRRAYICPTSRAENCMPLASWVGGIKDYYANGGGIEFDFSIAEK